MLWLHNYFDFAGLIDSTQDNAWDSAILEQYGWPTLWHPYYFPNGSVGHSILTWAMLDVPMEHPKWSWAQWDGPMGHPKRSWVMLDVPMEHPKWSDEKFQMVLGSVGWPNGTSQKVLGNVRCPNGTSQMVWWEVPIGLGLSGMAQWDIPSGPQEVPNGLGQVVMSQIILGNPTIGHPYHLVQWG